MRYPIVGVLLCVLSMSAAAGEKQTYVITEKGNPDKVEKMWGYLTADQKCTDVDARIIHLCFEPRFFDPSARVYFDSGVDDEGEIDLFNNGGLNPTIEVAAVYVPWRFGHSAHFDDWSWGPMLGVGMSSPAGDSGDGMVQASDAPVVMLSYGLMVEYELEGGPSFSLEFGRATGFSSAEGLNDIDDSATFVGVKIKIPSKPKESRQVRKSEISTLAN